MEESVLQNNINLLLNNYTSFENSEIKRKIILEDF